MPEGVRGLSGGCSRTIRRGSRVRADLVDQRPAKTLDTKINGIQGFQAPTGTSTEAFLRRLDKDRPDIHARVLAGELSAHAGMIEAGFRKKAPSRLRGGGPESRA